MRGVRVKKVMEHYEIYVAGAFYCSCDNITEVREELERLEDDDDGLS